MEASLGYQRIETNKEQYKGTKITNNDQLGIWKAIQNVLGIECMFFLHNYANWFFEAMYINKNGFVQTWVTWGHCSQCMVILMRDDTVMTMGLSGFPNIFRYRNKIILLEMYHNQCHCIIQLYVHPSRTHSLPRLKPCTIPIYPEKCASFGNP